MEIRTRIAPSPTGPFHIGTARTALFNFLFARKNSGKFVLRIEDTDAERVNRAFEKDIKDGLEWLGILWDEFYRQSERTAVYRPYLEKLLESGAVFWCPHTKNELVDERRLQAEQKEAQRHLCSFRDSALNNKKGTSILRFKNDTKKDVVFNDLVRGKISFDPAVLGDFSVAKNTKSPLYNFAVVVDDHEMKISHVIRGEDHISNTPKQVLLINALGFETPKYAHIPLILGADRSKLSKRHGATSVLEYKKEGYLPEAMNNFIALLGWHLESDRELFTIEELLKEFSLERIQKGGAVFNIDKLKWLNREYIKHLEPKNLAEHLKKFIPPDLKEDVDFLSEKWFKVAKVISERLTTLNEAGEMAEYFYKDPYYSKELLKWKESQSFEDILRHLNHFFVVLSGLTTWNKSGIEQVLMPYAEKEGRGETLWPLRVALSGKRASAGPFEIAEILGKEETVKRVEKAIEILS